MLRVRTPTDGAKNATVEVVITGDSGSGAPAKKSAAAPASVDQDWSTVVDVAALRPQCKRVRIDEIYFALSDKVEVQIAWHHPGGERHELMPLAGRGRFAWQDVQPSAPNGEHSGNIEIRTIGLQPGQIVYLLFDLTKQ